MDRFKLKLLVLTILALLIALPCHAGGVMMVSGQSAAAAAGGSTAVDFTEFTCAGDYCAAYSASATRATLTATAVRVGNGAFRAYKDYGAAYFDGGSNNTVKFTFYVSASESTPLFYPWIIMNATTTVNEALAAGGGSGVGVYFYDNNAGSTTIALREYDSGTSYVNDGGSVYDASLSTEYFITVVRDDAYGSYGRFTMTIRTGSHTGTTVSTQTATIHTSSKDYQYLMLNSLGASSTGTITGYVDTMTLE